MPYRTDDVRIEAIHEVTAPDELLSESPIDERAARLVFETRDTIHRILHGQDPRIVAVVGPCSVHDTKAAYEYAVRLRKLALRYQDEMLIVMRVYFEKPRTTIGWKGLINDPFLDGTFHINEGLRMARKLLLDINDLDLPAGTEYLDVITPQYIADLVSWGAIGARTTESQVHRQLASGLSCPVGFKNGTDGNTRIAMDAVQAARTSHHFLSVTKSGHSAIVATKGNEDCHIILRGGKQPNYDAAHVEEAARLLTERHLPDKLMIDCSHANSNKDYRKQTEVVRNIAEQITAGSRHILGVMIESNLVDGRQELRKGATLTFGQSVTDGCIGWEETERVLETLAQAVSKSRAIAV